MEEKQGMTDEQYADHLRAVIADLERIKKLGGLARKPRQRSIRSLPGTVRQLGKRKKKQLRYYLAKAMPTNAEVLRIGRGRRRETCRH